MPHRPRTSRLRHPFLAASLAAVAFAACAKGGAERPAESAAGAPAYAEPMAPGAGAARHAEVDAKPGLATTAPVDRRKIVRTGEVSLIVDAYDAARAAIDELVREAGGYVDSTRVSHSDGRVSHAVLVLRVPSDAFGGLLPRLRALGQVEAESTDATDVTDEYVDVAARLASARALEQRLLELAATGTGTVAEVLEVERELARVRGEIEQLEGRIRLWDDQVALSTLTITLATTRPAIAAPAAPGFGDRIEGAFDDSVEALGDAGESLALAGIAALPWLPLIIPGFLLGRRFVRRHVLLPRAVAQAAPPPPPPSGAPRGTPCGDAAIQVGQEDSRERAGV